MPADPTSNGKREAAPEITEGFVSHVSGGDKGQEAQQQDDPIGYGKREVDAEGDEMEKRGILEGMETMLIRSAGKLFTAPGLECSAASCQCLCTVAARGVPHARLMAYQD